jgi:hypothetical protein
MLQYKIRKPSVPDTGTLRDGPIVCDAMSAFTVGKEFDGPKDVRYTCFDSAHKYGTDLYQHLVKGSKHFDIPLSDPNMYHFDLTTLPNYQQGDEINMKRKDGFTYIWMREYLY